MKKPNMSLIPFDLVLDIDFAILKIIQFKYKDSSLRRLFCEGFMSMTSPECNHALEEMLTYRLYPNPVTCPMKAEHVSLYADKVYDNVMENNYHEVLQLAHRTALFKTVVRSTRVNDQSLKFTIYCKNEDEKNTALNELKKDGIEVRCILASDITQKTIDSAHSIYVKDFDTLSELPVTINGKNIIVADYLFNLQDNNRSLYTLKVDETAKYYTNKFHIASVYNPDDFDAVG